MKPASWSVELRQIRSLRLFHRVPLRCLRPLLREFRPGDLNSGDLLLTPKRRNHYLYLLLEGQLEVRLGSPHNPPVSTLKAGDCAGEISFLDSKRPCAYVVASQPCRLLRLHRQSLFTLFRQSPLLMQNILDLLCARIRNGNRVILDSEQNANIDSLTGVYNRRWLTQVFERESIRCAYNEQPLCLLILDVDHFKAYNDQHGHLAGDYALRMVANTLRNQLRPTDSLTRYGGEEFVILLPDMDVEDARRLGERLRHSLQQIGAFHSPIGILPGVTASIGLALLRRQDHLQSLIGRADRALYQAKEQGRNCLCG